MNSEDNPEDIDEISKSQRKRDADAVREFAARLVHTPGPKIKHLPLSDQLKQAIADCPPPSTRGAHKRHIQYISKLIRKAGNLDDLAQHLDEPVPVTNPHIAFCDQLIDSFTSHADSLRQRYPTVSLQQARQLAMAAGKVAIDDGEATEKSKQARKKADKARKTLLKLLTDATG